MPRTTSDREKSWRDRVGPVRRSDRGCCSTCASFSLACSPRSSRRAGSCFPASASSTSPSPGAPTGRRCSRRAGASSSPCSSPPRSSPSPSARPRRDPVSCSLRSRHWRSPCRSSPAARLRSPGSPSCSRSRPWSSRGSPSPSWRSRTVSQRADASMLALAALGVAPWLAYALDMWAANREERPDTDITNGIDHYAVQGALGLALAVLPAVAALRPEATPFIPACVGIAAAYLGLVSFAWQDAAGGFGRAWSIAAMAWGLVLVARALADVIRRSGRRGRLSRDSGGSLRGAETFEAVEDQVEPELELGLLPGLGRLRCAARRARRRTGTRRRGSCGESRPRGRRAPRDSETACSPATA